MAIRRLMGKSLFLVPIFAVGLLGACADEGSSKTGAAGTSGHAGTSGAAGTMGAAGSGGPGAAGTGTPTTGVAGTSGAAGTGSTGVAGNSGAAGTGSAAGTNGTAGTSGAAGTGGAAGTTGAAGTGGSLPGAVRSAGCGKPAPAAQTPPATFVMYKETITASALVTAKWQPRQYWVWLPKNYDQNRAYPIVLVGPGCGGKGNNAQPIQNASGDNAIIVGLDYSAAATGRDCFMTEAFPDPENNYVEETIGHVDDDFCVDKSRHFIEGFSSGSWISYMSGCVIGGPGGLIRSFGTATGNWQGSLPLTACKGATAFFGSHDSGDPQGYNTYPGGRDNVLKMNGCTAPPVTTPFDPGPMVKAPTANSTVKCVEYMGCKAKTVFCTTTGLGHNDQVSSGIATFGFWKFWSELQ
jgi:hypothetical protein